MTDQAHSLLQAVERAGGELTAEAGLAMTSAAETAFFASVADAAVRAELDGIPEGSSIRHYLKYCGRVSALMDGKADPGEPEIPSRSGRRKGETQLQGDGEAHHEAAPGYPAAGIPEEEKPPVRGEPSAAPFTARQPSPGCEELETLFRWMDELELRLQRTAGNAGSAAAVFSRPGPPLPQRGGPGADRWIFAPPPPPPPDMLFAGSR